MKFKKTAARRALFALFTLAGLPITAPAARAEVFKSAEQIPAQAPSDAATARPIPAPAPYTATQGVSILGPRNAPGTEAELVTLSQAIDRAMANNPDIQDLHMSLKLAEIAYDDAWDTMYMPAINFTLNSASTQTVGHLNSIPGPSDQQFHGYPSSSAQLSVGQYTFFNFGKDKLYFDQQKLEWTRTKEAFEESKRNVKFNVIIAFWTLKSRSDKLDAYNRSVDIAQAIVNLQQSRLPLGKTTETDVSSSIVDLLNVKNLRDQTETDKKSALFSLNVLLGDPAGKEYRIDETIGFLPIKVTEDVLYETYLHESPAMKTARKDIQKAQLNLQLTERNLLPLPTFKFSGINLSYNNNYYGTGNGLYTQAPGVNTLDISAGINLTVPILGPGGLFGGRRVDTAEIQLDQFELRLRNQANRDRQSILQFVQSIRQFEITVANNRQSYQSSMSVLESVFDRFMTSRSISRLEIRDAISQARDSEAALSDALLSHLNFKTQLAAFIGVDYLPRME